GFAPADDDLDLSVELALGASMSKRGRETRWSLRGRTFDAVVAARALSQLGARAKALDALDGALDAVVAWSGPGAADAALAPALEDLVALDPSDVGALRALARLCDRAGADGAARGTSAL